MYVCFGFSLARLSRARTINLQCQSLSLRRAFLLRSVCLSCMSVSRSRARFRRARMIDLQWQSLSLRRAFLLRSVCLSVRLTVESRPVCWPTHSKNQSKNTAKIDRRSIPGDAPGHPKSTQNRSRDHLGRPRVVQERPEGARERLGSVTERPRRPPGGPGESPRATRHARKFALERLGARRGDQNRRQVASEKGKIELSACSAFAKHRRSNFSSIFVDFRFFGEVCEPLKVLRLPAKTEVRPFALRVESLARCNLEKPIKSVPKSTEIVENRVSGPLGRAFQSTFVARSGSVERLGATRGDSDDSASDSERPSGSKWVGRGRSGSVGSVRSRVGPRVPWRKFE